MPRRPRMESPTACYHVIARGLNKLAVFRENREKTRILNLIYENLEEYNVKIYAYCIMSNHFHLLLQAELKELSSFMAKILAGYAQYYNYKHKRIGYVFQGRYRSQCIDNEAYFWTCLRYIHLNPVKVGLCKELLGYRHSSAWEYNETKKSGKEILSELAKEMNKKRFGDKKSFIDFHCANDRNFFIDIPEEELLQRTEIAREMLWEASEKLQLPVKEILDYTKTRNELEFRIKELFGISKKSAQEIRKLLENEMGTG